VARAAPPALVVPPDGPLKRGLDELAAAAAAHRRVADDPLGALRRYQHPDDIEIAAVFASALAFGRVAAFLPVVEAVLDVADAHGGPAAWLRGWTPDRAAGLLPLQHRWVRGDDLRLLAGALARLREGGSLGQRVAAAWSPTDPDLAPALERLILDLRASAVAESAARGGPARWAELGRGLRSLLCIPSEGSACKRWWMMLRWMVRGPDGVDLGLWPLPAGGLVIPLDTHVHRISRYLGLTARGDASFRTAREITAALRRLRPDDPVAYDFAIAHLGISGTCVGTPTFDQCAPCPLRLSCAASAAPIDGRGDGRGGQRPVTG
jgi:uncharacterized protein (TIGR02757 family)